MKILLNIIKHLILLCLGGLMYIGIEFGFRGYSHWTMFFVGGIAFISCGLFNEILSWETPLPIQMLYSACIITLLEFVSGYFINIVFKLGVWDYSNLPYNIMGQVCPQFILAWFLLALPAIVVDDYLRHILFKEEKPKYKIWY